MTYEEIKSRIIAMGTPERAAVSLRFFKTGKGQYGEGDQFIGITRPDSKKLAKEFLRMELQEVELLLHDKIHECRMTALTLLVEQYKRGDKEVKQAIYDLYLRNTAYINNWDLVDNSCYDIVGSHLLTRDRAILYELAHSTSLWEQRIAIVSTMAFIRKGQWEDTFALAELLLYHPHDLIQKAVGWLLREMGKRMEVPLLRFLNQHHKTMPRTTLRYSIERLTVEQKQGYMGK